MNYAISNSSDSILSYSEGMSPDTSIFGLVEQCSSELYPADSHYQYAFVANRLTKHYLSSVELNDSTDLDIVLPEVKASYLRTFIEVFPQLGSRLTALANVEDGWDGHNANSMSFESLGCFRKFLFKTDLFADDIGIYLDHAGAFIISYTDPKHGLVDMTFHNLSVEVCTDEFERVMTIDQAISFVNTVR